MKNLLAVLLSVSLAAVPALAQSYPTSTNTPPPTVKDPPKSWIDPDTGHRVVRLTDEPGSDSFYFNVNGYTPDGKEMAYTTADGGICALDLKTFAARPVVPGRVRAIVVGTKTNTVFYSKTGDDGAPTLWAANLDTGEARQLAALPHRASVVTINADETLGAGTYVEGDADVPGAAARNRVGYNGRLSSTNLGEPADKTDMMTKRLAAKLPMTLFTVDLKTGEVKNLIEHNTNWLNHLQFSPTDPTLLMYCHEGLWWLVDRIWTIRTDGSENQLIHQRTLEMEIAGHEWWGADGKTLFYQLHYPRGWDSSFIASYDVETRQRIWLRYTPDMTSIHDNSSPDGRLFCGDGGTRTPWIFLLRPVLDKDQHTLGEHLIKAGTLQAEKLVNMSKHNYRLEPNPSFTPDMKWVVFRSNMFGPDYAFAVEVAKASAQ